MSIVLVAMVSSATSVRAESSPGFTNLFRLDRVWDVSLSFTRDQWRALQPTEAEPTPMMGPGIFLAPVFFQAGDTNHDRRLTRVEFEGLSEQWFAQWDADRSGRLDEAKLKAGFESAMTSPAGAVARGGSSLPGKEVKRNGLSGVRGLEFNYVHADLKFQDELLPDVAVRYKGNGTYLQSAQQLKRPLKVDLNEFTKGQRLGGVSKLNFHNNVTDPSWMNEALAYRLYRDAGVPAPRVGYARLGLNVVGEHTNSSLGLYTVVENVDANFCEEHFGSKKGLLLKPSTSELFAYLGEDWDRYKQIYDPKTSVYASQARRVIQFCRLLTEADDATFAAQAAEFLDFDEVSRFLAVTVWVSTLDSILGMGQNFLVHLHPTTLKLQLIPWDLDHAFGQFGMRGSQLERERLSIREAWNAEVRFLSRLMKVPAFEQAYLSRLREFQETLFQPDRLAKQVDELAAVIRDFVALEGKDKLARFDKVVAGGAVESPGAVAGGGFGGPPAKPIKGFAVARHSSVAAQLAGTDPGMKISAGPLNPVAFIAPRFFRVLDSNQDRQVTRAEFAGKFREWFDAWDRDQTGVLNEDAVRDGLSQALMPRPDIRSP